MRSRLPYVPRVSTPRPRRKLRTSLDTPNTVEQVGKFPLSLEPEAGEQPRAEPEAAALHNSVGDSLC